MNRILTLTLGAAFFGGVTVRAEVLRSGDFNGDGRTDAVIFDEPRGLLFYGESAADAEQTDWIPILSIDQSENRPLQFDVLDRDGNGLDDLVVANFSGNRLVIADGQRDGSFSKKEFPVPGPMGVALANVVGGRDSELVTLSTAGADGNALVWFNPDDPASTPSWAPLSDIVLERGLILSAQFIESGGTFQLVGAGTGAGRETGAFHFIVEVSGGAARQQNTFPVGHSYSRSTGRAILDSSPSNVFWDPGHTQVAVGLLLPAVQAAREANVGFSCWPSRRGSQRYVASAAHPFPRRIDSEALHL